MDTTIPALMEAAERGDQAAAGALFAALYAELHALARRELARPGAPVSLGATSLLHQAYLDMSARHGLQFPDRPRFMGYAARVMRGVIIDHARSRRALRRGGRLEITALDGDVPDERAEEADLRALGDAIDALSKVDANLSQVVDLKFFCGFSFAEIAALRGLSERTVQRQWEKARLYLHRTLRGAALV